MHGIPVFRGTTVPVQTLFDYVERGETLEVIVTADQSMPAQQNLSACRIELILCGVTNRVANLQRLVPLL